MEGNNTIEKDYQQGIGLIQKYVSNYLVENYEGIEKIEWQGVGVECGMQKDMGLRCWELCEY